LTIQEIVNNVLKKPVFGFEGYEPKPTMGDNTIYANPNTHVRAKAKRIMFCEEASKAKDKVPAADKYQHAIEWNKNPTSLNIKFYTTPRNVIADDIIKKSQNPAKTSPGPAGYNHYDGWKGTLKKIPGTYKQREARITFMQEQTWYANEAPGMKYPSVNLRLYKETSPPRTHIKKNEGRFGIEKKPNKTEDPGPTSYDIEGAHAFANEFRGKEVFGKTKRVGFCE